jgi:DNA helicase-2/ATP-dependent DNA helicase PcrA
MIRLSDKQSEIVALKKGAFLILASAGSGKTRVLTERIKVLSEEASGKILAITFTNKAAAEIRDRLGNSSSIRDKVFVGTFHSFCQSILELRFKFLGYNKMPHIFEDDSDRIELIKEAINSVPYFRSIYEDLETKNKGKYTYNALQFISTVKRDLISAEDLIENSDNEEYKYLYESYQDILRSHNAIDFDDIIKLAYDLFTNNDGVASLYRKAYSYVCIDECQDLNKLQYEFLKAFCGDRIKDIMMVGDPNQAIYGFNGSTPTFMLEDFVQDFTAEKITLEENYRCSRKVIEASNKLMGLEIKASDYVINGEFTIQNFEDEEREAEFVVRKIEELLSTKSHSDIEGEIDYSKISILARNRFVFKFIEEALSEKKLPFYYKSGNLGAKFSTKQMKAFDYYLRIKINPLDKLHQAKLEDLLKVSDIRNKSELQKSNVLLTASIEQVVTDITLDNFHLKISELKDLFSASDIGDEEKQLLLNELEDLNEQLVTYKKQNLRPTLEGFKSAIALGLTQTKSKEYGICLSTVHTMKGQESEIVFLIGMDDGTFPDFRAIDKGGEDLQQEKNNLYVAFTRAKRLLFLSYPKKRLMPWGDYKQRSISRFLRNY